MGARLPQHIVVRIQRVRGT